MATKKKTTSTKAKADNAESSDLAFEDAIAELQAIVERMEEGDQTLEESVKDFERGMKLSKICQDNLKSAESRIDKLVKKAGGVDLEEFELDE